MERDFGFWIEGLLLPAIAIPGILGNILCVFVFSQSKLELKPAFANILKCLSVFDTLFLGCIVWLYSMPYLLQSCYYRIDPYVTPYLLPATQITLTGSVYSVIAVAVERYFNICRPFTRNLGSIWNGKCYIIIIIVFSMSYNFIKFFEYETVYSPVLDITTNQTMILPLMSLTPMRKNPMYATVNLVLNTVIVGLFPMILLWFLNWSIIKTRRNQNILHNKVSSNVRRDQTMTALLSGVVVVLIICHTPKTVVNMYECYQMIVFGSLKYKPSWSRYIIKLSHTLLAFSSAVNILIYSYKDFLFRTALTSGVLRGKLFPTCFCSSSDNGVSSTRVYLENNNRSRSNDDAV